MTLFSTVSDSAAAIAGVFSGSHGSGFCLVDAGTGLSVFDFDALIRFDVRAEGTVVSTPVEQGSFASYNKVDSPNAIEMQLAKQGTDDVLQAALKTLDDLQTSASKLSFVTPVAEYADYTLESYDFSVTQREGIGVLYLRLRLVEIREVPAQYADTSAIGVSNAKNASDASTADRGKVQATPTDRYDSMLSDLV